MKTGMRATSLGFDSWTLRVEPIDVDRILEGIGDDLLDLGEDPWGGANLYWISGNRSHVVRNRDLDVSIDDVGGPMTLADLRWLVEQCAGLDDSATVDAKGAKTFHPMDRDPAKITVRGKLK